MKALVATRSGWSHLAQISINYFGWVFCWTIATSYMVPNILLRLVSDSVKNTRLGLMSGASNIVVIVLIPLIGALSDRTQAKMGRRKPYFLAASCGMSLFLLLIIRSQHFLFLMALMMLMHASLALWFPNRALIRDVVPIERRGRISGLITIMNLLGMMAGHVIAPRLIEAGRLFFLAIIAAAANILANIWVAVAVKEPPASEQSGRPIATLREIYFPKLERISGLGRLAVFNLLTQMGMVAMVCFLLYFIKDQVDPEHFNKTFAKLVLIAMSAAIPSSFGAGVIADRIGRKRVLLAACLFQLVCIVNFLVSPRVPTTLYVSGVFYGLGNGAYLSMYWTIVSDMVPESDTSKFIGLMHYTFLIPWVVIPPTLGPLVDNFGANSGLGYNILFVLIICLLLGGILLIPKIPETFKKSLPVPVADAS